MSQTSKGSLVETFLVTGWAMVRSIAVTQLFIYLVPNIELPLESNIALTAVLTVFSLVEKYIFRRLFVKWLKG